MNEHLQRITALLAQACATYPGGKRGVFKAIEASEGKTLSESSFYAALNSNPTAPDTLKVSQFISITRVTGVNDGVRYFAAMLGQALMSIEADEPDAPTAESEMLQDFPAVVYFHEVGQRLIAGEATLTEFLQAQELALAELRQTTAKVIKEAKQCSL